MAKKKLGAKKLLNSRVNKLKYLAKKYEVIKEVSPRDYIKKPAENSTGTGNVDESDLPF